MAGYGYQSATNYDFVVARFHADGSLDSGFGSGGQAVLDLGGRDWAKGMALQSDGKILLAGTHIVNGDRDFALTRLNSDGTFDTTFGEAGLVTTDWGSTNDEGQGVALTSDGKIVVAGYSLQSGSGYDFALARYNSTGAWIQVSVTTVIGSRTWVTIVTSPTTWPLTITTRSW